MTQRPRDSSQWKHVGAPRPKKTRQSKSTLKLFMIPFFDSAGMIYMHWVPTGQTVNKEYYVEVLREFRKRFLGKRSALFKLGQWHFHQDNAPVHNSILVPDYLTKMGIKTVPHRPYYPDFAPCDFWLFSKLKEKLKGCGYETIKKMKESVTKVIDTLTWGLPEVVGTVQQVHCSRRRLLLRGLEFHVCTINKSAHTKNVWKPIEGTSYIYIYTLLNGLNYCYETSNNLTSVICLPTFKWIYIYIYIYIYVYIYTYIYPFKCVQTNHISQPYRSGRI